MIGASEKAKRSHWHCWTNSNYSLRQDQSDGVEEIDNGGVNQIKCQGVQDMIMTWNAKKGKK